MDIKVGNTCNSCPSGQYQEAYAAVFCSSCKAGQYSAGANSCTFVADIPSPSPQPSVGPKCSDVVHFKASDIDGGDKDTYAIGETLSAPAFLNAIAYWAGIFVASGLSSGATSRVS